MGFYETLYKSISGNLETSFGFPIYQLASAYVYLENQNKQKTNKKVFIFLASLTYD